MNGLESTASQGNDEGDSVFSENFWDEWLTPDNDNDGIVDGSYDLDGEAFNGDGSPIVKPNSPAQLHFITRFQIIKPIAGDTLEGTITIYWSEPLDSYGHDITYTLWYSLDGEIYNQLDSNLLNTSYEWDTTTVQNGDYVVKVEAKDSEGITVTTLSEVFTVDNPSAETTTETTTKTTTETTSEPTVEQGPGFTILMIFVTCIVLVYKKRRQQRNLS
jgi:hypothetical protein